MSPRTRARSLVLALSLGAAACGSLPPLRSSNEGAQATVVEVANRGALDMTVYVVTEGGSRERLGTATGLVTTRLTIPARLVRGPVNLTFQTDPVGSVRPPLSQRILVTPGDTVLLEIPPS